MSDDGDLTAGLWDRKGVNASACIMLEKKTVLKCVQRVPDSLELWEEMIAGPASRGAALLIAARLSALFIVPLPPGSHYLEEIFGQE